MSPKDEDALKVTLEALHGAGYPGYIKHWTATEDASPVIGREICQCDTCRGCPDVFNCKTYPDLWKKLYLPKEPTE